MRSTKIFLAHEHDRTYPMIHWVIICVGLTLLFVSTLVFFSIHYQSVRLTRTLEAFEKTLQDEDFDRALTMYRGVQEQLLRMSSDDIDDNTYEKIVLEQMEEIVGVRMGQIERKIRYERYQPRASDRAFVEGMAELTGARMSIWLTQLGYEYLLGTIEKPTLVFILDQIGEYNNVAATAAPLRRELDHIEIARTDVLSAEQYFASEEYIKAVDMYNIIIDRYEGLVEDYALERMQNCLRVMYEPLIKESDEMISGYRYYSAEVLLSDMARIFPDDQRIRAKLLEATTKTTPVEAYNGYIEVICVRHLIADADLALNAENRSLMEPYFLTTEEFFRMLEQLYENDFILIDIREMTRQDIRGDVLYQPLYLPVGKKPVIIIVENLNYSAFQSGRGLCHRLVLNDRGEVCGEYINARGQTVISRQAEAIGILDTFVEQYPDFTFDGAKGVISLTGYETVLGYVVHEDQTDDRNRALAAVGRASIFPTEREISQSSQHVIDIFDTLKKTGWVIGSSTYGFINANQVGIEVIESDTQKWKEQVGSLTGPVEVLVYPHGYFIKGSDPRAEYLKDEGFRIFVGIGPTPYFFFGSRYLYYDRAMMNGESLRRGNYSRLFDVGKIYDHDRRPSL